MAIGTTASVKDRSWPVNDGEPKLLLTAHSAVAAERLPDPAICTKQTADETDAKSVWQATGTPTDRTTPAITERK